MTKKIILKFAPGVEEVHEDGEFFRVTNLEDGEPCVLIGFGENGQPLRYPTMTRIWGLYRLEELSTEYKKAFVNRKDWEVVLISPCIFHEKTEWEEDSGKDIKNAEN